MAGPDAVRFLARYYEIWEKFWTEDIMETDWWPENGRTYLGFWDEPTYLNHVDMQDVKESRRLLERALERTRTDEQKARVEMLKRGFEFYEASVIAYKGHVELSDVKIGSEEEAFQVLHAAVETMEAAHKRRYIALERSHEDPYLAQPRSVTRRPALQGEYWGQDGLWAVAGCIIPSERAASISQ